MKLENIRSEDSAGRSAPIFAGKRTSFDPAVRNHAVTHDYAALAFYTGGACQLQQRGVWRLQAGDLLIVPSGEPHRTLHAHRPEFWGLGFCVPCLGADTLAALVEPFERVRDGASPVVTIPSNRHGFLETLFQELATTPMATGSDVLAKQSLLTLIVHEITQTASWSGTIRAESSFIAESLRYIERHCLRPLTLDEIAAAVNRTPSYVTTSLTRATGRSAGAWIVAGRMAEARRRILYSDESIETIAEKIGYRDSTHFIRLFRRMHALTPAAWRGMRRRSSQTA